MILVLLYGKFKSKLRYDRRTLFDNHEDESECECSKQCEQGMINSPLCSNSYPID